MNVVVPLSITVVGPGALGCLFAALLAKAGHSVWLLDHDSERADKIVQRGICLVGEDSACYPVKATCDVAEVGITDVVLLCVKSYDVREALVLAAPLLEGGPLLIALQNGLGHHEILRGVHDLCWAAGVTSQGAALVKPGVVRHGGSGGTTLGFMSEHDAVAHRRLAAAASLLSAAGLPTIVCPDIEAAVWDKLLVNVGINALTALYNCPNGELLERAVARRQLRQAVGEGAAVAAAKGIMITADPVARTEKVCRATSVNISSMLQDIRLGRRTEIESINGAIVREAAALGVDVPINEELTRKIRSL